MQTTPGAVLVALVLVGACGERGARAPGKPYALQPLSLPGAHGVVTLDYFAYDRLRARLWVPAGNTAYAAASKVGTLTVAWVDADGAMRRVSTVPTAIGARGVVADGAGRAYVADPVGGRILKLTPQ
jgi:hypothetical protein